MEDVLITVVTITYNAEDTVAETCMSVREQDVIKENPGLVEHLVIDGASRDATLQRVRKYGLPDVRIISEPDKGLYDAMNKGLRNSKGKYVIFLNSGDTFHSPDTLGKYVEKAKEGADIIYGDTVVVDSSRRIKGPRHLSAPQHLTVGSFANGMLVCHQAFMVRKEIAPEYNLDYRFSADYDWTIRCMQNGDESRFVNLEAVTIDYLDDGLTEKNKVASLKERYRIMSRHYGAVTALAKHLMFVPRAVRRKFSGK